MCNSRPHITLNSASVDRGYRACSATAREYFRDFRWVTGNLPGEQRRGLDVLLAHSARCADFLQFASNNGLPVQEWVEFRDDVSDAFLDKCTSVELAALADTVRHFRIPKQFLFDMLDGADWWIRNHKFVDFEELSTFACRLGGSFVAAAVPILGFVKNGYEVPAIRCGQAVLLTQLLANFVSCVKKDKVMLAQRDLQQCEIALHELKLGAAHQQIKYLARLYASRIEKLFLEGGQLIRYLDFDGKRTITSLMSMHWSMMMKMKIDPTSLLAEQGVLSLGEKFGLRLRHFLGTEGSIPGCEPSADHH